MIEQLTGLPEPIIGFRMSGTLHDDDYKKFVPVIDEAAKTGKIRLLAEFHDFHGWSLRGVWDDIKFATTHCTKFERIALVGEKRLGGVDGQDLCPVHSRKDPVLRCFRNG